jgi:hypothetical protein
MPIAKKYLADFEEEEIYHVYNRTNNKERLFLTDENRLFFLKRYAEILLPFVDTFCYNLLENHFHLLIRVKNENQILQHLKKKQQVLPSERKFIHNEISFSELIEHEFKRFFQSYSLALNKSTKRKGNLFYKPFKRIKIERNNQFTMTLIYIHTNSMKHGLGNDFTKYKWSSWQSLISKKPTLLLRNEIIEWFGSLDLCKKAHIETSNDFYSFSFSIED